MMRVVILDRDGVINHDSDAYIKSPAEWQPITGSLEAIARLRKADYKIVIATNQSGIGRGLIDTHTLNEIHNHMLQAINQSGGSVDAIFYCPHKPDDDCDCRKPKPGLLKDLAHRLKIDTLGVPFIGDSLRDLECARGADAFPILVLSGKNELALQPGDRIPQAGLDNVPVYADLAAVVDALLNNELDSALHSHQHQTRT